jgi:hypothetical protein
MVNHKKKIIRRTFINLLKISQKLAIFGLILVGHVLAAPERLRRDAPILPAWDVPAAGFEARGDFLLNDNGAYVALHDEYGVPHEDYGETEKKIHPIMKLTVFFSFPRPT